MKRLAKVIKGLLVLSAVLILPHCGKKKPVSPSPTQISWQQTNGPSGERVVSLAINSSGQIFAGTFGGGVFRSTNNGANWSQINTGLTTAYVNALAINSSVFIFAGAGGGVFRSTDNGANWSQINTGLTEIGRASCRERV